MKKTILGMDILEDQSLDVTYNIENLPIYVNKTSLSDIPQKRLPLLITKRGSFTTYSKHHSHLKYPTGLGLPQYLQ